MRLMFAAAVSLVLGLWIAFADDKKPQDEKERAEKFAALKKKFDEEFTDLRKRAAAADDPNTRRGLIAEAKELAVLTAQKAIEIAEGGPKDAIGFEASMFVIEQVGRFGGGGKEFDAAAAIIAENHLANAKVKDILPRMAGAGPGGEKFLKAVVDKSTDKEMKGLSLFFLGSMVASQIDDEEDDAKVDGLINKATEYFEKAAKEAPNAKVGETTIAKEVTVQVDGFNVIKNLAVGKTIPNIEGTDLAGKKVKLSNYKGKVVLVDIWATWCPPCRAMIPHEREMMKTMKDKPFMLLSVSCDTEQGTLTKFFEKEAMPWDHWFDGAGGNVAKSFRVRAFPTLYLIDHSGVIRNKWVGSPGNEKLDKAVEELVKEAMKAKG